MSKNFKFWLLTVGLLIIAFIITVWVLQKQKESIKEEGADYVKQLNTYYGNEIRHSTKGQLQTLSKTFVWALRSEIIRDNYEQADIYFDHLIKEDRFQLIVFADIKGKIIISTQKKIEGQEFGIHYDVAYLENDAVQVNFEDDRYKVSAPVMGLSRRLGTLYYEYSKN